MSDSVSNDADSESAAGAHSKHSKHSKHNCNRTTAEILQVPSKASDRELRWPDLLSQAGIQALYMLLNRTNGAKGLL